jgi:hypothetical protein
VNFKNILKIVIVEEEYECMERIQWARAKDQWRALVKRGGKLLGCIYPDNSFEMSERP